MAFRIGFLDLCNAIWNNFVKGLYAYQPIRKANLLKQEIKKMEN